MAHTRRLFVALWPDESVRERLAALQHDIRVQTGLSNGAVDVANLHLTLRFLGNVEEADIQPLTAALSTVSMFPFHLELDRMGQFPKPGILWLGPSAPPDALIDCQRQVLSVCNGYGQAQKEKRFRPHVTLFRKVRHLQQLDEIDSIEWLVDRLVLAESITRPEGVLYRVLEEVFAG